MSEAKWTPMVVVRAAEDPAVVAMECRANRGTNDSALYLEKTSIRGRARCPLRDDKFGPLGFTRSDARPDLQYCRERVWVQREMVLRTTRSARHYGAGM